MTLVAIITVLKDARDQFHAFETHASAIMKTHGGCIERTVVVEDDGRPDVFKEIHVLTFPDARAFAAYRSDPLLAGVAHLREASVVGMEVFIGEDGPTYGAA
ncbi:MAG: hypothetical protein QM776_14060 [Rhodocyclaceae bacterium]